MPLKLLYFFESMEKIRIAIAGVGNCASSLIQGIEYYQEVHQKEPIGLMHPLIGDYRPSDIQVVAAFDIDRRKVGKDVSEAIFEKPNCTQVFCSDIPTTEVKVQMGQILDGYSEHMRGYSEDRTFQLSKEKELTQKEVVQVLIFKDRNFNELPACGL